MDVEALEKLILDKGRERIPFVRMEAGTNLIGGQPFSLQNLRDVKEVCLRHVTSRSTTILRCSTSFR